MLVVVFWSVYVLSVGVSVWSAMWLKRFVSENPSIANEECLGRYKALVRTQMYLALFMIVLLAAGFAAGIALIGRSGLGGLGAVLVANGIVFSFGMYHRQVEKRVRSLPTGSEALARDYQRVSECWVKKPLPDF